MLWGAQMIRTDLKTTDVDFPDLSHLRTSRVAEFSKLVARNLCVSAFQTKVRFGRLAPAPY
ncbi:hypothetical protein EBR03_08995 [bacterium]|nr:hypothetical protein [bacterium]